ncbi:hypothetical protein ACFL2Q_12940 [Thermodesulfobacteriota bacterium]
MPDAKLIELPESMPSDSASPEEEGREEYLDYCAAAEAIEEALETSDIMPTQDFATELGFDY